MREILAMAAKDLHLLLRDKAGFFFTLFFPLIIAVFFGAIFGGGGGRSSISILVVDEDKTDESQAFVAALDSASEIQIRVTEIEEAVELVRRGKRVAYVILKEGFGEASRRMFWGEPPTVELGVDPARRAEAAMLQGILMKYGSERFQNLFSDPAAQRENIERARTFVRESPTIDPETRNDLEQLFGALNTFLDSISTGSSTDSGTVRERGFGGFEPLRIEKADVAVTREGPTSAYEISFPQGVIWGIIGNYGRIRPFNSDRAHEGHSGAAADGPHRSSPNSGRKSPGLFFHYGHNFGRSLRCRHASLWHEANFFLDVGPGDSVGFAGLRGDNDAVIRAWKNRAGCSRSHLGRFAHYGHARWWHGSSLFYALLNANIGSYKPCEVVYFGYGRGRLEAVHRSRDGSPLRHPAGGWRDLLLDRRLGLPLDLGGLTANIPSVEMASGRSPGVEEKRSGPKPTSLGPSKSLFPSELNRSSPRPKPRAAYLLNPAPPMAKWMYGPVILASGPPMTSASFMLQSPFEEAKVYPSRRPKMRPP